MHARTMLAAALLMAAVVAAAPATATAEPAVSTPWTPALLAPRAAAPQFNVQTVIDGAAAGDQAGVSVAVVDGQYAFVGVPGADVYIPGEDITIDGAGAVYVYQCSGGAWTLLQTITDSETIQGITNVPWENESFGASLAVMTGDGGLDQWLAIGAPGFCGMEAGVPSGAVDIWWLPPEVGATTFQFRQTLWSSLTDSELGASVALAGASDAVWLLAGQPGNGEVLVYSSGIDAPEFGGGASFWGPADFGSSVAVDADGADGTAVVGAPGVDNGAVTGAGSATFFALSGGSWATTGQTVYGPAAGAALGSSVAVDGAAAVVGMPGYSDAVGENTGGAVTYAQAAAGTWSAGETLLMSAASGGEQFGASVAFDGTTGVIGAPASPDGPSPGAGSAVVYDVSGAAWTQAQVLTDDATGDAFGAAVSVAGSTALVGAPLAAPGGLAQAGAATVYSADTDAPAVTALSIQRTRTNHTVGLCFRVGDRGARARVVICITECGILKQRLVAPSVPTNEAVINRFLCRLAPGVYRWTVYAQDAGGNHQRRPSSGILLVLPER